MNSNKPKFIVPQPKPRVDPAALEAFAAQADVVPEPIFPIYEEIALNIEPNDVADEVIVDQVEQVVEVVPEPAQAVEPVVIEPVVPTVVAAVYQNVLTVDRTKAFLLRLLPDQFDRMEKVFAVSSYKSKQKMGEQLLMQAVEELAKKLGV
jgi:hypothetical protein